jgi:methionine synthase II (cobalamin-independent)
VFVGVIATIDPHIETPQEFRDGVIEASRYIPVDQLGNTDDCGFALSEDSSTSRDTAFEKIRSRVLGTRLAESVIKGD